MSAAVQVDTLTVTAIGVNDDGAAEGTEPLIRSFGDPDEPVVRNVVVDAVLNVALDVIADAVVVDVRAVLNVVVDVVLPIVMNVVRHVDIDVVSILAIVVFGNDDIGADDPARSDRGFDELLSLSVQNECKS
ncbi:unnamed protein product [Caenorhabditis auriculariae]|uniref:Uncharacterized protein n=1 Tax=Caenorhabditis auriculariae TaxID=2777116 RepID=A0A8S1GQD4_9PELO|nr:unnamed protein product [Caenorhabditis auriculariae]